MLDKHVCTSLLTLVRLHARYNVLCEARKGPLALLCSAGWACVCSAAALPVNPSLPANSAQPGLIHGVNLAGVYPKGSGGPCGLGCQPLVS